MDGRFTDEELAIAKSVDLCAIAGSLGYTVKRIGKYHTLKEMDSIRIYNRRHWYRWSRQFDKGMITIPIPNGIKTLHCVKIPFISKATTASIN